MWDKEDRKADSRRLDRGEGLLERGHETPATTVQDAELDEILEMPPYSVWPPVTALTLAGVFAMLLMRHYWIAARLRRRRRVGVAGMASQGGGGLMEASPRGAVARSSRSAAAVARSAGSAQPSGWWGMALFMCAEATLFGILIATYFYLDFDARSWPPDGIKPPSVVLPLVATAVLISTTIPLLFAVRASRAARRRRVVVLVIVAVVVQCCYLAVQILLFTSRPAPVLAQGDRIRVDLLHAADRPSRARRVRDPARTGGAVAGRAQGADQLLADRRPDRGPVLVRGLRAGRCSSSSRS